MSAMSLLGLVFDFDGLLVDTESALIDAWETIHAEDGIDLPDRTVLHALVGHAGLTADRWAAYPQTHDRATLGSRYQTLAHRLCREAPPRDGVIALLDSARDAGLRLAVASNTTHFFIDAHLADRGLRERFTAVVCRDDVPRGKPAPDVYLAALEQLGLNANEAVAFEDSVPGHQAAVAAGLRVVVVPNPCTRHCEFPHASLRVSSLSEVTLASLLALGPARAQGVANV